MADNPRPSPPTPALTKSSSYSSLNTNRSSNPGGKNFVGFHSLSIRSNKSAEGNEVSQKQINLSVSGFDADRRSATAFNQSAVGVQAIKAVKPHSRTAIGRLTYRLNEAPAVLLVDLSIQHKTTDHEGVETWEPVRSTRLRKIAAEKWVEKVRITVSDQKLAFVRTRAAVDSDGDGVDARIAFPVKNRKHKQQISDRISMDRMAFTDTSKPGGGDQGHTIYCKAVINDNDKACEKSITLLLKDAARRPELLRNYGMGRLVDARLPSSTVEGRSNNDKDPKFEIRLRTQPAFDLGKNSIHLDFDLVPCLPEISGTGLLNKLLGAAEPTVELIEENMTALRSTLCGLNARCTYKPGPKLAQDRANLLRLDADDETGREVQIQDVQPHSVPSFKLDQDGKEIKVEDYFDDGVLNEALPFVRDNTGAWIPLELLTFNRIQPLLSFGNHSEVLRKEVKNFLKTGGLTYMERTARMLFDACGTNAEQKKWLSVSDSGEFTSTPDLMHCVRRVAVEAEKDRVPDNVGIVHISQTQNHVRLQMLEGILGRHYSAVERKQLDSATFISNSSMIAIEGAKLLLVIIDETEKVAGKTKARLHRTAERTLGVPLICMTLERLEEKLSGTICPDDITLNDLHAKIDFMLGHTKIDRPELRGVLEGGNYMIIGAHVAHTNNDKVHSPSISALVASKNASCLQYSGSVRVQRETSTDGGTPKLDIDHLQNMMVELFKQWKNQEAPPSQLLFFRDRISFDDALSRAEFRQIQRAYTAAFPHVQTELEIAYIVVNKNTALTYEPAQWPDDTKVTPKGDFLATGDDIAKYRYYIVGTNMKNTEKLADITGALNASSQLNPNNRTSKALPLMYADKLARRVHDYFRHEVPFPKAQPGIANDPDARAARAAQEQDAVQQIQRFLGMTDERQRPWASELDGSMFFL